MIVTGGPLDLTVAVTGAPETAGRLHDAPLRAPKTGRHNHIRLNDDAAPVTQHCAQPTVNTMPAPHPAP
ncbi:hypothetical protein H7I41_20830 [Mycobacterium manitobense]|uniref:Uncharacterized protein n=1 Tax=[Mycobacterium] manitobense TaxID=190147 RepID=A0A9X3BPQ6_9MYCO|nr:hypothetical protein [[Mycobacterium] manitobense]MCV7172365.1 hypothetical protein [[Mycobacterium] manitobense]